MTNDLISRRFLLAAAAATPPVPALFANDRIAIFSPPPERIKIASVGFQFTAEEVNGFKAQGKNIEMMVNDPSAFEHALPGIVRGDCGTCAVSKIASMATVVSSAVAAPRSLAWLVGGFALLAVMLAAAGVYGFVSHGVLWRTREIGIRLALGASPRSAGWLVMASSLRQVAIGTTVGLATAWVLVRWMESLLYRAAKHDVVSFSLPPVVLIAVALLASSLPMVRAARIDPAKSLREG